MSSTTLPVCPKTGSTSPSLTVHLCLHTALLREIGNAPAGVGLMAAAFDYRSDVCPSGYSTHTYQDLPTQCVRIDFGTGDSDVREATTKATLKRKGMLWSGVGAIGLGTVVAMLPEGAPLETVSIDVAPDHIAASKTFGWGGSR